MQALTYDEIRGFIREQQDATKSPMAIRLPAECTLPNLNCRPLITLNVPSIIHDISIIYGWLAPQRLRNVVDDKERWYAERGAIAELAVDAMFRALDISSIAWGGLFTFDTYDFVYNASNESSP